MALYLARPVKRKLSPSDPDPRLLAPVLVPGDVLLTEGNSRMAGLVRLVTRSSWAHVAMYVGPLEAGPDPRCIVEADIADGVRAVPLSELTGQRVRVLRHYGLDDAQRRRLADWVVSRIGGQYDLALALVLAARLLRLPVVSRSATGFICSTLLAQAFLLTGHPIVPDHSYVVPRDFEAAAALRPVLA